MRGVFSRLRAALTPQVLMLLAAAMLLAGTFAASRRETGGATELERRIGRTLSGMDGAGRVEVVIMTRSDTAASGNGLGAFTGSGAQVQEVACGAVAVAQGADDPLIRMQLEAALSALLGLPASAVSVVTGGN